MKQNKIDEAYYEETDFSGLIKSSGSRKLVHAKTKRVTMNISELAYDDAHEIDKYMNMGYQNVLKTAIMLGLNDLFGQLNAKKGTKNTSA